LSKEMLCGTGHLFHIFLVCGVPFLNRQSRVAQRETIRLGRWEVDLLSRGITEIGSSKRGGTQRPASVGRQRGDDLRDADSGDFVAIVVGPWNEGRIGGPDRGNRGAVAEARSESPGGKAARNRTGRQWSSARCT